MFDAILLSSNIYYVDDSVSVSGGMMYACNTAVVSMNIRPQTPAVTPHTSSSLPETVGRPLRPWVKITSNTVNGLRYTIPILLLDVCIGACLVVICLLLCRVMLKY